MELYGKGITTFTGNGITVHPTSAVVSCGGINDMERLDATFSLTSRNVEYIEETATVKFKGPNKTNQFYKIIEKDKDNWNCYIVAVPLIYAEKTIAKDMTNEDITQVHCVNMTGQQALTKILDGTKYTPHSNITSLANLYLDAENLASAINGTNDNTFVKRWGGEIFVDNYDIYVNERIGTDKGYRITYGKNLKEIKESIKMEGVVTRLVPYNSQNIKLGGATPWIDSPNIAVYDDIYEEKILFDKIKLRKDGENFNDDDIIFDTIEELRAEMVRLCNEKFEEGIDKPEVTLNISVVDLARTQEYKAAGYEVVEKLTHGDTVYCKHIRLGIESTARMVGYKYDIIAEAYTDLTIGAVEYNFFDNQKTINDRVESAIDPAGNVLAESVRGEMNAMYTSLRYQRDIAEQKHVRAEMYVDNVLGSPSYGMMATGSRGLEISDTKDQYGEWIPQTCITAKGVICDSLYGNYIKSRNGVTQLNMITGELNVFQNDGGVMQMFNKGLRYKGSGESGWAYYYMARTYCSSEIVTDSNGHYTYTFNTGQLAYDCDYNVPCNVSVTRVQAKNHVGYQETFRDVDAWYIGATGKIEVDGYYQALGVTDYFENLVHVTDDIVPLTIEIAVTVTL